jgi:hypothetical protein
MCTAVPCGLAAAAAVRVRVEIMGPGKYENVGKSQSVLVMIDPIISTRTRHVRTLEERLPRRRRILVHAIMALPVRARAPCVLLLLELLQEQGSMLLHQRCARSTTRCQSVTPPLCWLASAPDAQQARRAGVFTRTGVFAGTCHVLVLEAAIRTHSGGEPDLSACVWPTQSEGLRRQQHTGGAPIETSRSDISHMRVELNASWICLPIRLADRAIPHTPLTASSRSAGHSGVQSISAQR